MWHDGLCNGKIITIVGDVCAVNNTHKQNSHLVNSDDHRKGGFILYVVYIMHRKKIL